jgi:hypothetical protein
MRLEKLDKRVAVTLAGAIAAGGVVIGAMLPGLGIVALLTLSFLSGAVGGISIGGRDGWLPAALVLVGLLFFLQLGPFSRVAGDAGLGVALIYGFLVCGIISALIGAFVGSVFGRRN